QMLGSTEGFYLPKGADIVLQVHYHKDGKPETDLTKIGLKFAKGAIDKAVRWESVGEEVFTIPPGQSAYPVTASMKIKNAITVLDVIPHMHLLGHDMTVTATLPDGTKKQLIQVENYDFNWQTRYTYREPVHLPAGTELSLVAHYDNSTNNPHNPNNPPKAVSFGEQTTDEMCYAFFSYTYDGEHISKGEAVKDGGFAASDRAIDHIFDKFDADHDGFLDVSELATAIKFFQGSKSGGQDPEQAAKLVVAMYGKSHKGKLTHDEFKKVAQAAGG
ncbi:MAG TPA: EF-hand domain-containing protein, partial [Fimbriimonadaceae bacterium]|nr:EF-hand domain-containing protein [Fimbriimonadaceae bacterium]